MALFFRFISWFQFDFPFNVNLFLSSMHVCVYVCMHIEIIEIEIFFQVSEFDSFNRSTLKISLGSRYWGKKSTAELALRWFHRDVWNGKMLPRNLKKNKKLVCYILMAYIFFLFFSSLNYDYSERHLRLFIRILKIRDWKTYPEYLPVFCNFY